MKNIIKWFKVNSKVFMMDEEQFVQYCKMQCIDGGIARKHFNISKYMNNVR